MKNFFICLCAFGFLCSGVPLNAGTAPSAVVSVQNKPLKADVVLDVTPIRVKPLKEGRGVDALEKSPEEMDSSARVVVFRINRVLRGELAPTQTKGLTVLDQLKDAAYEKSFLKLVTMDFHRPEEESGDKETLSMIVTDPHASFGIRAGEVSAKQRYRISLARIHQNPDSYLLVKSENL